MVRVIQVLLALCATSLVVSCAFTGFWWLKYFDWTQSSQATIHAAIAQAYSGLVEEARVNLHMWSMIDIGLLSLVVVFVVLLIVCVRIRNRKWSNNR